MLFLPLIQFVVCFLIKSIIAENSLSNCTFKLELPVEKLLDFGQNIPQDVTKSLPKFPCWFDPTLARIGQKFAKKNFGSVFSAHAFSLIPLLSDKQNERALFLTGRSSDPQRAYKRYVATARQIHLWYTQDILSSNWITSISNVRKIHEAAASYLERMNSSMKNNYVATNESNPTGFYPRRKMWEAFKLDLENAVSGIETERKDYSRPKYMQNQYTMSIALWGFMALPVMIPYRLGIVRFTETDLKGFVHLWGIIAYMLGAEEEFIFCKDVWNGWEECKDYMRNVFRVYLLPQILDLDFEGQIMIESLLQGLHRMVPPYPVDAFLINFLEGTVGTLELRAKNLRRQRKLMDFLWGTGANLFTNTGLKMLRLAQWTLNFFIWGELQVGSKKTFGDPGRNFSVVALTQFYVDK